MVLFIWDKNGNICLLNVSDMVMREFASIYGEWSDRFGCKWKSLGVCARYFDYSFDAHDSLEDVRATLYCYNKIKEIQEDVDTPHG